MVLLYQNSETNPSRAVSSSGPEMVASTVSPSLDPQIASLQENIINMKEVILLQEKEISTLKVVTMLSLESAHFLKVFFFPFNRRNSNVLLLSAK